MEMPTKAEMERRVQEHRAHRADSDVVNLLWRGYLTALFEWELLSEKDYRDAVRPLRDIGVLETEKSLFAFPLDENGEERLPTLREISEAIDHSVERHANSQTIRLIWKGYLAGLAEWARFFRTDDYHALDDRLGDLGEDERREIFNGVDQLT